MKKSQPKQAIATLVDRTGRSRIDFVEILRFKEGDQIKSLHLVLQFETLSKNIIIVLLKHK